MDDYVRVDTGRAHPATFQITASGLTSSGNPTIADAGTATQVPGSFTTERYDLIPVTLTAGETYSFAERPTATGGIEDPYLALFSSTGDLIAQDDDGGFGRSSLITFTPTTSGTYFVYATSWYHVDPTAPGYPDYRDAGTYTVDIWSAGGSPDAPATLAGAVSIGLGTTFGHLNVAGDKDMYKIQLTAGQFYTFTYAGGIAGGGEYPGEQPGENIGILRLYDANGVQIQAAVNYETGLGFLPDATGTYYLRIEGYDADMTGGYTLDVSSVNPAEHDPLDAIDWRSAANIQTTLVNGVPTAFVYFATAADGAYGLTEDDGTTPIPTYGWQQFQIDGVMRALQEYTAITGINYVRTTDVHQATFRLLTTINDDYGAQFFPQDPAYGDLQGIGVFNLVSGGFTDPASLQPGGFSFAVILHEFGHAHGLAHPHDDGGGSEILIGVTAAQGSLGIYDLNQGVYTVMSYNDGWQTHPDGTLEFSKQTLASGWSGTLSAFDIAELQERYGEHAHNGGNNVYEIVPQQKEAYYQTIWDTGGTDTISYTGGRNAHIDLLAATLDYSPTGGGVVSFVSGTFGGYTIAHGVVIENATGGSGHDELVGNSVANTLTGNNGNDSLVGREGDDLLLGGNGKDVLRGDEGADSLNGGAGKDTLDGGAGNDTLAGGADADTYVFNDAGTDTILGYERGEKFDLSHLGVHWSDVTIGAGKITVDLAGSNDLVILVNTSGITQGDFIFT
jgi:Ca2+-binding RTX toxin-like protein